MTSTLFEKSRSKGTTLIGKIVVLALTCSQIKHCSWITSVI